MRSAGVKPAATFSNATACPTIRWNRDRFRFAGAECVSVPFVRHEAGRGGGDPTAPVPVQQHRFLAMPFFTTTMFRSQSYALAAGADGEDDVEAPCTVCFVAPAPGRGGNIPIRNSPRTVVLAARFAGH